MHIKKILIAFLFAVFLLSPSLVLAQNDYGAGTAAQTAGLSSNKLSKMGDAASVIGEIINIALSFIGIIFFLLILYAGFTWMTAMGSSEQVTKAKNIIEAAVIGLVLVGGAYAIANFVFSQLGSGGGGGEITPAAQVDSTKCQNDSRYKAFSGYSCRPVSQCSATEITAAGTVADKIAACKALPDPTTEKPNSCNTAICGGGETVCCN